MKANSTLTIITEALKSQKGEFVEKLVSFVVTDTILYQPHEPGFCSKITAVNDLLGTHFVLAEGIGVPAENLRQQECLRAYLEQKTIQQNVFIYLAAMELRSVLLGVLWQEGLIDANEAFTCAFCEELKEQGVWGKTEEIVSRHREIKDKLSDLERWKNEGNLSEN